MKKNKLILIVIFISLRSIVFGQEQERLSTSEIKEIIELAIELPELQQYFHIDNDSLRTPLMIKEFGVVSATNLKNIQKSGIPIKVIDEKMIKEEGIKAYLNIKDWTYIKDNLKLQMNYTIEGIVINMKLSKINNKWEIIDSSILEH